MSLWICHSDVVGASRWTAVFVIKGTEPRFSYETALLFFLLQISCKLESVMSTQVRGRPSLRNYIGAFSR